MEPEEIARRLAEDPGFEHVQTHISHVFLGTDRVYKLHKAVRLPYVDFGERAARNADCLREVELNRRLAPDVYLGVAPVLDGPRIGAVADALADSAAEHVVVMRRLPAGGDALSMVRRGELTAEHLERVAERLVPFHATHGLGRPAPWSESEAFERVAGPCLANCEALRGRVDADRLAALERRTRERLGALRPWIEARRLAGRAVDGHGDVHLEHVWFEDGEPRLIDCLEFDAELRAVDPACEVAFLAMDLRYRGRPDLAEAWLAACAGRADDFDGYTGVDFYAAYRAMVRAKVAGVAASQESVEARQREAARGSVERHLALAEQLLEPPATGSLVVLCGTVGSGKSTVARRMAHEGRGVPIASDRIRKTRAGLAPDAHPDAGIDEGLYDPDEVERVYAALLERAVPVVDSGRTAILDAGFATRAHRDTARVWADQRGVPARLVEVRCSADTARARLEVRARAGADPSDAGPEFLPVSLARFEPPDEWPSADREVVETD